MNTCGVCVMDDPAVESEEEMLRLIKYHGERMAALVEKSPAEASRYILMMAWSLLEITHMIKVGYGEAEDVFRVAMRGLRYSGYSGCDVG